MRRALKILGIVCGSTIGVLLGAVAAGYALLQSDFLRHEAQSRVGAAIGRETTIGGTQIDWGWTTHVRLSDVRIANASWSKQPYMLEARMIDFQLRLAPLLTGAFEFPEITLDRPKIVLERAKDGRGNWSFGESPGLATAAEIAAPDERDEAPIIDKFVVTRGKLTYLDHQKDLALNGDLRLGAGEAEARDRTEFQADGTLEGKPIKVAFTGGSVALLQDTSKPYPLKLVIDYGQTAIDIDGHVDDPFQLAGVDLQMKLKGPDLSEIFPILGVPAPSTPPYSLKGHLTHKGDAWQLQNMTGIVGDSDLSGDVKIDYGPKRPMLTADLTSKVLDFDDLGPLIGIPPATEGNESASAQQEKIAKQLEAQGELFPDLQLKTEKLRVMDMDVTLKAKKVIAENYLPVQSLDGHVSIDNGRAVLDPFKMGLANGVVQGSMILDAKADRPRVEADLALSNLDLKTFFKGSPYVDTTDGKIHARVKLKGNGKSLADVMGTGEGDIRLGMKGGAISWLLVELAGLDIGQALILYVTDDERVPIRCGAGRIALDKGVATLDRFIVDTTDSVLYFRGDANLKSQAINIEIEADAKDFSLLDIDAPIELRGKIRKPEISIGKGVPIPLIEPGDAVDVSCSSLLSSVTGDAQD
ncbi:AsmA family protein [Dongia rigui]|uniref:AsmA family protein n=1 Tax=Dongia rigui TaxID=940149 RepID=A0ABU5E1X2_9PROT|nr:AsmA family protein [Dongia rigui]MDY0873478.1 AsmA family protein [Dongia rigui]